MTVQISYDCYRIGAHCDEDPEPKEIIITTSISSLTESKAYNIAQAIFPNDGIHNLKITVIEP